MTKLLALIFLVCCSTPATAAYRCELAGKLTYSDEPCPTGVGKNLPAPPEPAAEEVRAAQQRARQERLRLTQIEQHQRAADERELQAQRLQAKIAARNKKHCESLALQKKWRAEELARATPKSTDKLKRQARHAAERYALDCKS